MTVTTIYANTGDGSVLCSTSNYANCRAGSGALVANTSDQYSPVGQQYTAPNYAILQGLMTFDTSSVPDSDDISAAVLTVKRYGDNTGVDFDAHAYLYDYGGTIQNTDYCPGATQAGLPILATFNTVNMPGSYGGTITFVENGTVFQSNINKTGTTGILIASARAANNIAPTANNESFNYQNTNQSGTTNDPKLVITHEPGTTQYTQGVGGALSFTGAARKASTRSITGAVGPAGAVLRSTLRALAGVVSLAGVLRGQAQKWLTGDVALGGLLALLIANVLTGAMDMTSSLRRHVARALSGSADFAGAANSARLFLVSVGGVFSATASLRRRSGRSLAGSLGLGGGLVRHTASLRAGALNTTGQVSMGQRLTLALSGGLALTGGVQRTASMHLSGALHLSARVTRGIRRVVAGVIALVGGLTWRRSAWNVSRPHRVAPLIIHRVEATYPHRVGAPKVHQVRL